MNKPFKLAFFGDAICTESRAVPNVRTFVDIILQHYGADVILAHKGTAGGVTIPQILEQIQATEMDIACVFYGHDVNSDPSFYKDHQASVEQELKTRSIPTVHFVHKLHDNHTFTWGITDDLISKFGDLTRTERVVTNYESSDNGIDFVGNNLAAERIIPYIDQLRA